MTQFCKQLQELWDAGSSLALVCLSFVSELPGNKQVWPQPRSCGHQAATVDSFARHRLHGADFRAGKFFVHAWQHEASLDEATAATNGA